MRRKLLLTSGFLLINALAYFLLLFTTGHTVDLFIPGIDDKIGFIPQMVWSYFTLFPVMLYTLFFRAGTTLVFDKTLLAYALFVVVSSVCYAAFPSVYPVTNLAYDSGVSSQVIAWLHSFDNGNTCPSGHVAFSLITALSVWRCSRFVSRILYSLWFIMILISTLTLKQHHVIDLIGGIAAGSLCVYASGLIMNRKT